MSAPTSHDPVAVNTSDDRCWVRRGWSPDGRGLYALEGSPEGVGQTLFLIRELAAFGLRSMAYLALPAPAGPAVEADGITQRIAPTQALQEPVDDVSPQVSKLRSLLAGQREVVDGEHYAAVHRSYTTPHDLDFTKTGGQR